MGPVTAVRFSTSGDLVYVGMGAAVHVYDGASGQLCLSLTAIDGRTVHGLDVCAATELFPSEMGSVAAVYGHKKVKVFGKWPSSAADGAVLRTSVTAAAPAWRGPPVLCELPELDDLIWDARLLRPHGRHGPHTYEVAIAMAHNFVELWTWCAVDGASGGAGVGPTDASGVRHSNAARVQRVQRVCCVELQVVFAMSFLGREWLSLRLATGTVMNQILLWAPGRDARAEAGGQHDVPNVVAPVQQRLLGHAGVVFRVVWSADGSSLASCSDDRTVRLWRADAGGKFSLAWTGWGHKERLWDVSFCALGLITASEDKTCKVWDPEHDACIATLDGHGGHHIWKVAVDWSAPGRGLRAITGGNDAAAQLWQLGQHVCGPQQLFVDGGAMRGTRATMHGIAVLPLPVTERATETRGADSAAAFLRFLTAFAKDGAEIATAPPAPCFELFPLEELHRRPSPSRLCAKTSSQPAPIRTVRFCHEARQGTGEMGAHELAMYVGTSDGTLWRSVLQVHTTGGAESAATESEVQWQMLHTAGAWGGKLCTFSVLQPAAGELGLIAMASPTGDIALLFRSGASLAAGAILPFVHWRAHATRVSNIFWPDAPPMHVRQASGAPQRLVLTAAADGSLCWWKVSGGEEQKLQPPRLAASFAIPGKGVVTSLAVLWERSLCLCGDNRGNIFVFSLPKWRGCATADDEGMETCAPLSILRRIHGQDAVTVLVVRDGYVFSAGHDGNVRQFRLTAMTADGSTPPHLREVAYYSTAPVVGVESLFWSEEGTMLVAGFYSGNFMVADVDRHYVFAKWRSGGWKRPHAFWFDRTNPMRGVVLGFAPPAPKGKARLTTVPALHVQSTFAADGVRRDVISQVSSGAAPPAMGRWSLHSSFHGSVVKAVRWVDAGGPWAQLLLTGCQDNTLRLSRFDATGVMLASVSREAHSAGIRAIAVSRPPVAEGLAQQPLPSSLFFASVGGKEEMACWQMFLTGP